MRGNFKQWVCVFAPLLLILAFCLYLTLPKWYSEADVMSPEFCRDFIQADFAKYGHIINRDNLEIIGIRKIDNMIFVGYSLERGGRSWDYGIANFSEYFGGYIFRMRRPCFLGNIPELASGNVMTNYGIGNNGTQGYYLAILSRVENLRRIVWEKDGELVGELEVDECPALLILPKLRPPEDSKRGSFIARYSFLDEDGVEIDCWNIHRSWDTNEHDYTK